MKIKALNQISKRHGVMAGLLTQVEIMNHQYHPKIYELIYVQINYLECYKRQYKLVFLYMKIYFIQLSFVLYLYPRGKLITLLSKRPQLFLL